MFYWLVFGDTENKKNIFNFVTYLIFLFLNLKGKKVTKIEMFINNILEKNILLKQDSITLAVIIIGYSVFIIDYILQSTL